MNETKKDELIAEIEEEIIDNDEEEELQSKGDRKLTSTGELDRRGGKREGAGRPPTFKKLSNYTAALEKIDGSLLDALDVLIEGMSDADKWYRKACAETLLKKSIADKKRNEVVGDKEQPILIGKKELTEAALEVDKILTKKIHDKKRQKIIDVKVKK